MEANCFRPAFLIGKLPQMMICVFVSEDPGLLPAHLPKERMYKIRVVAHSMFLDQRDPFHLLHPYIVGIGHDQFGYTRRVSSNRLIIFCHGVQGHSTEKPPD